MPRGRAMRSEAELAVEVRLSHQAAAGEDVFQRLPGGANAGHPLPVRPFPVQAAVSGLHRGLAPKQLEVETIPFFQLELKGAVVAGRDVCPFGVGQGAVHRLLQRFSGAHAQTSAGQSNCFSSTAGSPYLAASWRTPASSSIVT